jgi:hypothetical protein
LLFKLGGGRMGMVFRAHDRMADVDVAIKILRSELSSTREGVDALRNGFRKALAFKHDNLVNAVQDVLAVDSGLRPWA